ncbi:MAG: penicillin-binding transpeptidase domain-containing protein, partial [Bryobacteraceae bacterium]
VAGAYTVFVNHGVHAAPYWLKSVRDEKGQVLYSGSSKTESVLDPRVAFEMVDLLQEVVRRGTAAGVRSRGFSLPAAGKTGTSHDGWFAGFTSKLVCVVWVGFDDNRELGVEGARSALPIWTEFMKRAHEHRQYRNARSFEAPDGIVMVEIDPLSGGLATPTCPKTEMQAFLAGSQPVEVCRLHGGEAISTTQVSGWETEPAADKPEGQARPHARPRPSTPSGTDHNAQSKPEKKREQPQKGIFRRLLDMFK